MTEAVLSMVKSEFEKICPFEIRYSHSPLPVPHDRPVIIINADSINTEGVQNEGNKRRFPLTAEISVKAYVPFKYGISELRRIASSYILPVMSGMECCITGFSEGVESGSLPDGMHTLDVKFKIKGVYTVFREVNS